MKKIVLFIGLLALGAVLGAPASGGPTAGRYIVVLEKSASLDAVLARHESLAGVEVEHTYRHALNGYAAELSPQALAAVRTDSRVAFVSPDRVVKATAQTLPTGIDRIDGETSSTRSGDGTGSVNVNVAVVDTGIDSTHPDLNVVGGRGCAPGIGTLDGNGHGSHVSGTIAAKDDANGVVGVVPGARLYAVKVLNDAGVGLTSDIVCGIDWVTSTRTDLDPNNNIAVANMSIAAAARTTATAVARTLMRSTSRSATPQLPASRTSSRPGMTGRLPLVHARRIRRGTDRDRCRRLQRSVRAAVPPARVAPTPTISTRASATSRRSPPIRATRSRHPASASIPRTCSGCTTRSRERAWPPRT